MIPRHLRSACLAALAFALAGSTAAFADIKIGLTLSATGPAAALGVPEMKALPLLPTEIGGEKVEWIALDDGADPAKAAANARKLIAESNIDALIGSTVTISSLPLIDIVSEAKTPLVTIQPAVAMILPMDDKRRWVFKVPPNPSIMANAVLKHMQATGVKTIATLVFADAFGQIWSNAAKSQMEPAGLKIVAAEEYARTDTSVSGQVLRIVAAKPDAVLIGASGSPAVLPVKALRERGYKGPIYQTDGVAGPDYIRVGGKDVEGSFIATPPFTVAAQLPDDHPVKARSLAFKEAYQKLTDAPAPPFAAHLRDAGSLLEKAIPVALKAGKPGTPEFRAALRDALETGVSGLGLMNGVYTYSATDHAGLDDRAAVISTIKDGAFVLVK